MPYLSSVARAWRGGTIDASAALLPPLVEVSDGVRAVGEAEHDHGGVRADLGAGEPAEYWWFVLFTLIASAAAGVLDVFFPGDLLQSLFGIATFIPGIALGVRRMHDIGKSGWWLLVGLIPIIGWIVLIVWLATKSDAGSNQWGVTERA